ncbi:hypothetical protein [Clavibacter michiganensis]|uniref:Lipoprotein n=1 Tax=Clavibacter michiganensis TaxID=28447 RepID=A0A251YH00_9MICO|nr:hypothetical protein [Clavibacter michiganensis]OUE23521.1 hypothetical protein BFL37_12710 [Clavibacter michiganensis]
MPRTARAPRVLGLLAATLLASVSLSACTTFGYACNEPGYANTLDVQVVGSEEAVAQVVLVRMCDEEGCSQTLEQSRLPAIPESDLPEHMATATGPGRWTIARGMTTPAQATITALAADGTTVTEVTPELSWRPVDPFDRCEGPKTAGTVDLSVAD